MNTRRTFTPISIMVMLAALLLPMQSASASGAADIGGSAGYGRLHYSTARYITDNSTPGPSVVFEQDYGGPGGLRLGAWNCNTTYSYPWGGMNPQQHDQLRFVADGVPNGYAFCLATDVDSGVAGSFSGRLYWD